MLGISAIIVCGCLISTSDLILDKTKIQKDEGSLPKYVVLLFAFLFPLIASTLLMVQKQVICVLKVKPIEFACAYMFLVFLLT